MDIVEQLRTAPMRLSNVGENAERLILSAADEIERLKIENERLTARIRRALKPGTTDEECCGILTNALNGY